MTLHTVAQPDQETAAIVFGQACCGTVAHSGAGINPPATSIHYVRLMLLRQRTAVTQLDTAENG